MFVARFHRLMNYLNVYGDCTWQQQSNQGEDDLLFVLIEREHRIAMFAKKRLNLTG